MGADLMGILRDLNDGVWTAPGESEPLKLPYRQLQLEESFAGREGELVAETLGDTKTAVVCDQITEGILGSRVHRSIGGDCELMVLESPRTSEEHVQLLRERSSAFGALVAVGSGTVSDLVKYATFLDGKPYCVFPTSPMNAYTTKTASITVAGKKRSIPAHNASGVFFDMEILAGCPPRLLTNALADVVCRTTAQVDWRMQRAFLDTPYSETPYLLLAHDEANLLANAGRLHSGDLEVLAALTRTCALNGMGTLFTGTTHAGSMAEHQISHYLDDFAADHPGTLHGEQVGVATLTVLRLQNTILGAGRPPTLAATRHTEESLERSHPGNGAAFVANIQPKILDERSAESWNERLANGGWDEFTAPLREVMLPLREIAEPMQAAGCQLTAGDLGFEDSFYNEAVRGARFLRDRFTILDLADDSGLLEGAFS